MASAFARTLACIALVAGCDNPPPFVPPAPASQPTSQPATQPATKPTPQLVTLLDVVRANDPKFPTTQPLTETLEISAAARLRIAEPTYLCSRGDVWITRADAPPTPEVLAGASKNQTHVSRERIAFVYWRPGAEWSPELVAQDESGKARTWVTRDARLPLDDSIERDWSRAGAWNTDAMQAAVVPTKTGVSVIRILDGKLDEKHVTLLEVPSPGSSTQYVLDMRGLLAWSIDPSGESKVARFIDNQWKMLADMGWPANLVQVVPFLDGTVLAIGQDETTLKLRSVALDTIGVDEAAVMAIVKRLVERDPKAREKAQAELVQIGPGAWPLLRKLAPTQPPEARIRIRAVLGNETTPTLGGITPAAGPARVVCRLPDGGVVLRFDAGASAVNANGVVQSFSPAWIAVRPGEPARQLPVTLSEELASPTVRLNAWGDEWIVEHDVDGPKRWMGNHTEPMVRKSEAAEFKRFVGIDAMGRWIFKTPDANGPTLILDPTLPDPRPRLPVWAIDANAANVGWSDDDWPVMRGGDAWMLKDGAWAAMKGNVDANFKTSLPPRATTRPTTSPAEPLLTDEDGNRYFDGHDTLIVETKDGRRLTWTLPAEAVGPGVVNDEPVLVEAEGKLFLFNAGGKLARLTKQLDQPEPCALDAIFTRHIPGADIRRFWKDPAGRLVFASGGNQLAIAFPSGRISPKMSNMIPAGALRDALEEEAK